jgi:polyisoprenoid-binding protein YceI
MTQPDSPVSAQATIPPGTYRLDPERSTVRADTKAMFGLFTVHGTLRLRSGEITVADDPTSSGVQASVDAASYASGNATRDKDITSANFLDAEAFPEITFEGTEISQDGTDWIVSGEVTAHGTSVPAKFRVHEAAIDNGEARFQVTTRLERASFGVTKKKGMVGSTVDVAIDAVGVQS